MTFLLTIWHIFRRGGGQKVVGFSFYGNRTEEYELKKGYFAGIKGNLVRVEKESFYPISIFTFSP